jgi:hypothetical protein
MIVPPVMTKIKLYTGSKIWTCLLPFTKQTCCTTILKRMHSKRNWNKILNIKPSISQISGTCELHLRGSVLLVEETGVPGENHRLVASHWQILSHNVVSGTPRHEYSWIATLVLKVVHYFIFYFLSMFSILQFTCNW